MAIFDKGRETTSSANNVGIAFFHGSPDAPEVDILAGNSVIFDNISYGNFSTGYVDVPAASYNLAVTPGNNNSAVVARYTTGDLSFWKGKTLTVFASGFLSGGNPAFEPWVALSGGGTFPLAAIQGLINNENDIMGLQKSNTANVSSFTLYPNPASEQVVVRFVSEVETNTQIDIINIMGQSVFSQQWGASKGMNEVVIPTEQLKAGQYIVRVKHPESKITAQKLSIQK